MIPRRLALVLSLSLAGAGTVGAARAEEGVAIKNLLGALGIIAPERDPIRYRERAPLVLPPRMDLRDPASADAAQTNPEWPLDPDVVERRRRAAEERLPVTMSETRRMSDSNPRLSIYEIRGGRRPGAEIPEAPVARRGDNVRDSTWVHPDQLRGQGRREEETSLVDGEPVRRLLTDPPSGMRRSASGAPVRPGFEPRSNQMDEDADPKNYIREQAQKRR